MTATVQDLIDSVKTDPLSVGLCCHRYAFDPLTKLEIGGIKVVPLDCNRNGKLENKERFYDNLDQLQRAFWLGKYPCRSFHDYYMVVGDKSVNKTYIEFMKWVLTEGQHQLHEEGYVLLRTKILNQEIKKLDALLAST